MFDPRLKSRKKFWKYLEQFLNYYENLPLKRDQNLLKMLVIFRVNNVLQKNLNLTFFVIYSYQINILPSTSEHQMKKFINIHAIIEKNVQLV